MAYKRLDKLFYEDSSSDRESANRREAHARLTAPSTFRTGIDVGTGELFLAVPRELSMATEQVLRAERKVSQSWNGVPGIAQGAYVRNLIIDEVVCTNEMEGVRSTRKQIEEALDSIDQPAREDRRAKQFMEFANLYLGLTSGDVAPPKTPADVRALYDAVVAGTLRLDDALDGELFRADGVDVRASTQRVVHRGVHPESAIVSHLRAMIGLAASEEMPELYSALLSHYLFEYIHPFYDGNGRTGRFLLALYLSNPLSLPTTLSLSRVIAEHKSAYYRAFSVTEHPLNHGEATFFVLQMMDLIRIAQDDLVTELQARRDALAQAEERLGGLKAAFGLSERACALLYQMVQVTLFGANPSVALRDMAGYLEVTVQSARKYASELEHAGLVDVVSRRPLRFRLAARGAEGFGIAGA
ncbi:Fic family protein [Rubneribacter sp.]|nr:Fic family protein [Candidatus Rubneribacter avistercoris]